MTGNFPASHNELTIEWLSDALRVSGVLSAAQAVSGFTVLPIGSGFGQTGESVRLRLQYNAGGSELQAPPTIFAKFATPDPVRRQASQRLGLYTREVDFYTRLAPQANVRAPRCYFAAASPAGDLATLLLEDFPDHRPGDDIEGLKPTEAGLAVDLLAELHAPFWGRGASLGVPPLNMGSADRFNLAWEEVERSFGDEMPDAVRRVRRPYINAIAPLHEWLLSEPSTLGHGDLKLDNILFGDSGADPIVAVDWQAVRPQRGMRDFGYLVSHSMRVDDRRTHEKALLQRYLDRLSDHGIAYEAAMAEDDYRKSMLFDFCTVLYIVGVNLNSNERAVRRKRALMERAIAALLDWDAFDLLDQFR